MDFFNENKKTKEGFNRIISYSKLKELSRQTKLESEPRFLKVNFAKLKLNLQFRLAKTKTFLADHTHLLLRSAAENHLRIQRCKNDTQTGEVCDLAFNSYSDLKQYQKKVRLFTYSLSSTIVSIFVAVLIVQVFFSTSKSSGATFTWLQTNWLGGVTTNKANHGTDQTGWTQYADKDAGIVAVNDGADIQLQQVAASVTQTSDTDFNAGTKTDTAVVGAGLAGGVSLTKDLHVNEYTVGHLVDVPVTVTAVSSASPWLLTLSGTPNLARTFKNDEFTDSAGKKWKVLSLNPSNTTPRFLVIDSEENGGAPATGLGHTGRWFADLAAWEAGRQGDLVARNAVERALPYYDVGPDTTPLVIDGWTTDATHFVEINVPLSERHRGKWDVNKYRMYKNSGVGNFVDVVTNHTKIDGFQIEVDTPGINAIGLRANDVQILNSILKSDSVVSGGVNYGVRIEGGVTNSLVYNTVIYGFKNTALTSAAISALDSTTGWIYNSVLYGSNYGVDGYYSNLVLKNIIAQNNDVDGFHPTGGGIPSFSPLSDYNISDLAADAPGINSKNITTVAFVDVANKDFHLEFNDTAAKNAGVDLSADANLPIKTDIDGDTRTGTWDIGADDVGATFVHTSSIGTNSRDFTTLQAWEDARDGVLTTRNVFKITSQSGAFAAGETITGGTSGATGVYIPERATPSASETYMSVDIAAGTFQAGETLTGGTSLKTATLSSIVTTGGTIEKGEAYNDSVYTTGVDIAGSTTDATHYMWLTVEPRSRHQGIADTGTKISASKNSGIVLNSNSYSIIEWFDIASGGAVFDVGVGFGYPSYYSVVRNNIIRSGNVGSGTSNAINFGASSDDRNSIVENNIIYGYSNGIKHSDTGNISGIKVYNNALYGNTVGILNNGTTTGQALEVRNNIAVGNTINFSLTGGAVFNAASSNNISSDGTAPGTSSLTNKTLADVRFVSTGPSLIDLHLMPGSVARNVGADLSATFKNDIDGNTRPTGVNTWDIGVDEWKGSSPTYKTSGIFESGTIDLGVKADISALNLGANTNPNTSIKTQIAVNNDNATWNYVDYGQEQSGIPIYYSVGQNTNDHKAGTPTVDIVDGLATFSVAQTATNMGVGDKVTYNGSSVAYISGKISQTQWKVITNLGVIPANATGATVNSITHAFSSLNSAVAGASGASYLNTTDLVKGNYQLNFPAYYDSGADTTAVTVNGYNTAAANYIKIYTPNNTISEVNQSQRHQGKWDDGKYRLESVTYGINVNVHDIKIDGLQIKMTNNAQYSWGIRNSMSGIDAKAFITNNIIQGVFSGAASDLYGITFENPGGSLYAANNVIYGFKNGSYVDIVGIRVDSYQAKGYVYNNLVYDSYMGYQSLSAGSMLSKNNIAQNCSDGFSGDYANGSDYNISNLANDAPGVNSKNSTSVDFADAANNDFHLLTTDTAAKDAGINLSVDLNSPFVTDIDGQFRIGTWDIGVDEVGALTTLNGRYVRYKTIFSSDSANTPKLDDLKLNYSSYPAAAALTSSVYDTTDAANILAKLRWTESLPAGADVTFQVRTSPDNVTWTSWVGPDGTNATEFTDPLGNEAMPNLVYDGVGDRYIQYKAILHSDGVATPILSDADITYVVNAVPQIQNVAATQNQDGTVTINYEVKDLDALTGSLHVDAIGYVNTSLQYCSANCAILGGETWTNAPTTSGNVGLVVAQEATFTPYAMTWTPKTDYPNQYFADMKMRVVVDDGEAANNLAYGSSAAFVLDTKNPTNVGLTVDGKTKQLALVTPADDSTYQMLISNFADFHDAVPQVFATSLDWPTLTADPATVYLRIIDAKGNKTDTNAITPQKPQNIVYFDVSNAAANDYREFIAWSVVSPSEVGKGFASYEIERKENSGSFVGIGSQTSRSSNFYMDNGLLTVTTYSYRTYTKDIAGNQSAYSDTVSDIPNGQGGTDTTPPTITAVTVQSVTPTSATITWTTDELADSSVGFSEDTSFLPEYGIGSMVTSHSITLTNLAPETQYHVRVKSRDPLGNLGQVDEISPGANSIGNFIFTTLPGPKISQVTVSEINNTDATIVWKTDVNADSQISYSQIVSGGALVNPQGASDTTQTKNHSVKLAGLVENTRYYFEVVSKDNTNNETKDNNANNFFELLTTQDTIPPVVQNLAVSYVASDAAIVSFVTDEPATIAIDYGTTSKNISQAVITYDRSHTIFLSGLTADKNYTYAITAKDINNNSITGSDQTFQTLKNFEFIHDPLTLITFADTNPSVLTDTAAVISFTTNQAAKCFVEYGNQSGNYDAVPKTETNYNVTHNIQINGLLYNTRYFYKVVCEDNLATAISSSEKDFTTKEKLMTGEGWNSGTDSLPPTISNIKVSNVTGESVTITWDTDEVSNSSVRFGVTAVDENINGDSTVNSSKSNYAKTHSVILNGLVPSTKYVFVASSTDTAGNIAQSSESSFTTASPSSISSIKAESKNLGEATITWQTSETSTSIVEYGLSTTYEERKESTTQTKDHSISLSNLNQGVTYHFRVKGKDQNGKLYASSDQTFEPKSPPQITDISINDINEHEATVSFATSVPTSANVFYTNVQAKEDNGAQADSDLATKHSIRLKSLSQGSTFTVRITARDEQGTESQSDAKDFTTGKDENPPKIDNIKTDSALTQSDKVQAIIAWKTDEQSTTSLIYKEGKTGTEKEINISDSLTTAHVAVITTFKPGTVYYFKVKSIDSSKNEGTSSDFALLTPRRKENIIQIIINNFQEIFGWAKT